MNAHAKSGIKQNVNAVMLCLALLTITFTAAGCSQDPIFATIEKEVKLKDPTIVGQITSLVDDGTDVYATNGKIYKRTAGKGSWNTISHPDYRCAFLATDTTNKKLYGLFQNENWSYASVQMLNVDGSWTAVTGLPGNVVKIGSGDGNIFAFTGTASPNYSVYTITDTAASGSTVATGLALPVGSSGGYFATVHDVYDAAGASLSFPLTATATDSGIRGIVTHGSDLYILTSNAVYRHNAGWTSQGHDVGSPNSIAYLDRGTATDLLLISGSPGYGEVKVDHSTGAMNGKQKPGSNTESSIQPGDQSQYENSVYEYPVTAIYALSTFSGDHVPEPALNDYIVYASVQDYKFDGLWAYYSNTQTEWNRE